MMPGRTLLTAMLLVASAVHPLAAGAQETRAASPGDRIRILPEGGGRVDGEKALSAAQAQAREGVYARITSHDGRTVHGTVDTITAGAIVLVRGARRFEVARKDIQQVETAVGRRYAEAMAHGAQIGTFVGMAIGFSAAPNCAGEWMCMEPWSSMLKGAAIGISAGLIVGASLAPRNWITVPLDDVRVTLHPMPGGGLGPAVSVRF